MPHLRQMLLNMDIGSYIKRNGLVCLWITNKQAMHDHVLGEDGLFAHWNVALVEEWIWLKTTVHGEPILALDSLWRKPYEVLLLGRKIKLGMDFVREGDDCDQIKRRVIISVPDAHSRKPCLKELIEPLMADPNDYRALEIFPRHLVAGWWSWGNECLRFNWDGYWQRTQD